MSIQPNWKSRIGFVLSTAGSAVGLGNIWKFPYVAAENGGGIWILIYLMFVVAIGLPILIAESYIGQHGRTNCLESIKKMAGNKPHWKIGAGLGIFSSVLTLALYSVVGGWVLYFFGQAVAGCFQANSEIEIRNEFSRLTQNSSALLFCQFLFLGLTYLISVFGIKSGIEKLNKFAMPGLILMLVVLVGYLSPTAGFSKSVGFLFHIEGFHLTSEAILSAMGHAIFTISVGCAVVMTYGSFLERDQPLGKMCISIVLIDTFVAIVASLVVLSLVFSLGESHLKSGPGLLFQTIPLVFSSLPEGGYVLGILFFLLVAFATLTSSVSMLEPSINLFESKWDWSRKKSTSIAVLSVGLIGLLPCLSFTLLKDYQVATLSIFDFFNLLISEYLLPIGGILVCLVFAWKGGIAASKQSIRPDFPILTYLLHFSTKWVAPLAIGLVFLYQIFA